MFGPLVPGTIGNGGGIPCIKHARTSVGLLIKLYPVSQIQYLFGLLRRLNIVGYQFIPFISRRQEDIKSRICFLEEFPAETLQEIEDESRPLLWIACYLNISTSS